MAEQRMFRVRFSVRTTIMGEADIMSTSEEQAELEAEDKILELIDQHDKEERRRSLLDWRERDALPELKDPVDWDTQDAEDNVDIDTIDISEVNEL